MTATEVTQTVHQGSVYIAQMEENKATPPKSKVSTTVPLKVRNKSAAKKYRAKLQKDKESVARLKHERERYYVIVKNDIIDQFFDDFNQATTKQGFINAIANMLKRHALKLSTGGYGNQTVLQAYYFNSVMMRLLYKYLPHKMKAVKKLLVSSLNDLPNLNT